MTVQSPDINVFDFGILYDLSGATPIVKLTNFSSGPNLDDVDYWFILTSPSNVKYHLGVEGTPDRQGPWNAQWTVPEQMPEIQGHIDWSGANWEVIGFAKDSEGTIFQTPAYRTKICRPSGNEPNQRNNYGGGQMQVMMNCCTGKLLVEDVSNYSYNGLTGQRISSLRKLVFPPDDTETSPAPFTETDTNTSLITIPYNGKNYQLLQDSVYEYDFGNNTFVRIKYKYKATFEVNCGIDLCAIVCAIENFEAKLQNDGCTANERNTLLMVLSKLNRAMVGLMQPLCGINVPKILSEIRDLLGGCVDCETKGGGINPANNCAMPVDLQVVPNN